MATERFTKSEFESALTQACNGLKWECFGYIGGEIRYYVTVKSYQSHAITINVNSSIGTDGLADSTGEDSIRVWIMAGGKPHAKTQAYVTRVAGWQKRLAKTMSENIDIAKGIPFCRKCGSVMVAKVSKYGPWWCCSNWPTCQGGWNTNLTKTADLHLSDDGGGVQKPPEVNSDEFNKQWVEHKNNFAKLEEKLEREGFASDPDYQRSLAEKAETAEIVAAVKEFIASKYQLDIFDWAKGASKALVVKALAGTGKTTTGLKMLNYIDHNLDVRFLAFNKTIAEHVRDELIRLGITWVKASTYHSMGYSCCADNVKNLRKDDDKVYHILENVLDMKTYGHLVSPISRLVSLVKYNLTGVSDDELAELADHYAIEMNGDTLLIYDAVRQTIKRCAEITDTIDYDDMCWLPVIKNWPMRQYDMLVIDEGQDTDKNQIALAMKALKPGGRVVVMGDEHQSLYGFRGADVMAIPNLISALNADVLPLSVTYRNPKCVVALVRQEFDYIPLECPDNAPEGIIRTITDQQALVEYTPGDMVLCRTNAPLVKPVFSLIARGIKAIIRGRDISTGLLAMIKKTKQTTLVDLIKALSDYKDVEIPKLTAAKKTAQAQALEDKVDTLVALSDGCTSISELQAKINDIFSDDNDGVVFSSVHKAKGLEAQRVFILRPDLMPHPMAKQEWEQVQEANIKYVAYTRTLNELVFVTGGK